MDNWRRTVSKLDSVANKILKEQGSLLTDATDGSLIGEAALSDRHKQHFSAVLRIKVPSLNNYIYNIVKVEYPISIYPVTVIDLTGKDQNSVCKSVDELRQKLKQILGSDKVKSVITALLAQVSANAVLEA